MRKTFVFIILFTVMLSFPAKADDELIDKSELESAASSEVLEATGGIDGAADTSSALSKLWSRLVDDLSDNAVSIIKRALSVAAVAAMCGVLSVFREGKAVPDWIELSGCAAIGLLCIGDLNSYTSICRETLYDISSFSQSLLPALCTLSAASGAVSSASVKYAASALFMDIMITLAVKLILPLIFAFSALSLASSAFGNKCLGTLCKLVKKLCVISMTTLSLGFTLYLGISSAITSAGDALTLKVAKTTISTVLPVVGGIISDAATSIVGGAQLLKSTVGVFGMLAVAFMCVTPFAILGANYLAYKVASAAVAIFGSERLTKLTDAIGDTFGMLLGLVGCAAIMMFISIISTIKAVTV